MSDELTLSGRVPDPDFVQLVKEYNPESAVTCISNILSGNTWQLFDPPEGISGMGYSLREPWDEIKDISHRLGKDHPLAAELARQTLGLVAAIPVTDRADPLLNYTDLRTSKIYNALYTLANSQFPESFPPVRTAAYYLLEQPILTREVPPDTADVTGNVVACILSYKETQVEEVRAYLAALEERKLFPAHIAVQLAGFGEARAIDFLIERFVEARGETKFEWGGLQTLVEFRFVSALVMSELAKHNVPHSLYDDKLARIKDDEMRAKLDEIFTQAYQFVASRNTRYSE